MTTDDHTARSWSGCIPALHACAHHGATALSPQVIRMYRTLLGWPTFRKGMDLYFKRHDGQAVTCDDFRRAMADASGRDLTQFERWYLQVRLHLGWRLGWPP